MIRTTLALVALLAVAGPARAQEARRIDWKPAIASAIGQGLDGGSTLWFLHTDSGCVEGNPRLGPHPSTGAVLGSKLLTVAPSVVLALVAAQPHAPKWTKTVSRIIGYTSATVGTASGVRNLTVCRR